VTKAGLFYWEVQRAEVIDDPSDHYDKGKVWVPFVPKPLEFDVDFAFLDPLLKVAMKLWKSDSPAPWQRRMQGLHQDQCALRARQHD